MCEVRLAPAIGAVDGDPRVVAGDDIGVCEVARHDVRGTLHREYLALELLEMRGQVVDTGSAGMPEALLAAPIL